MRLRTNGNGNLLGLRKIFSQKRSRPELLRHFNPADQMVRPTCRRRRSRECLPKSPLRGSPPEFAVRHFSPVEIAGLWNISVDSVRKIFENEPGVLVLGNIQPRRGKRNYTTLRIPAYIVERVHRRLSKV
jgi:hypothetical protein